MESNDMIFDIDEEITSQGFNVESLLLKNQFENKDDHIYKHLKNTLIPFGLLYKKSDKEKSEKKDSFLKNDHPSEMIDENLYSKLLEDFTFKEKSSRKKKTYRQREKDDDEKIHRKKNKKKTTKKNR
jgi:hypothetical protein